MVVARSQQEVATIALEHFAGLEDAKLIPPNGLHDHVQNDFADNGCEEELDIDNIIPLSGLVASFSRADAAKALGADGFSNRAFRLAPVQLARLLHPLLVKVAWYREEPQQHLGGVCVPLFEGKDSPLDLQN